MLAVIVNLHRTVASAEYSSCHLHLHRTLESGHLNFLGLLHTLILGLRIADGLGQHLAQLGLGLRWFALGWVPLRHK
jgi:hypothetical protein